MATKVRRQETRPMDPQCGKLVNSDHAFTVTWEGKTYFFCSQECKKRFEEDPPGVAGF
jgi:YHS domain-containing protein